jgi:hypothetical protein
MLNVIEHFNKSAYCIECNRSLELAFAYVAAISGLYLNISTCLPVNSCRIGSIIREECYGVDACILALLLVYSS